MCRQNPKSGLPNAELGGENEDGQHITLKIGKNRHPRGIRQSAVRDQSHRELMPEELEFPIGGSGSRGVPEDSDGE
jgi:hypothetical protein